MMDQRSAEKGGILKYEDWGVLGGWQERVDWKHVVGVENGDVQE